MRRQDKEKEHRLKPVARTGSAHDAGGGNAMRLRWIWLTITLLLWPLAPGARGQSSRKDDIVLNARGLPLAGATVRVCAMPASGQPCTPLALIYSDAALTQALANPTTSDGLGNYYFYAAPGKYMIEISGTGITTRQMANVILPSDPTAPAFSSVSSSGAMSAFSLNLGGNLSVGGDAAVTGSANLNGGGALVGTFSGNPAFSGTPVFSGGLTLPASGNGQLKPASSDAVRYVSSAGNDSNDGLSWGSAKLTIYGACISLPGGSASPPTCGQGTIYFSDGASANPTTGAGVWLMSASDPNYASPPTGWLRFGGAVSIIGVPKSNIGPNPHMPKAALAAGSNADRNHPSIWLSGTQGPIYFQNIGMAYPGRGVVIGECSTNTRTNTCSVSNATFDNVTVNIGNAAAANGPSWDLTGGSFWIFMRDCGATGNAVNATGGYTANNAAAILLDGTGNNGIAQFFTDRLNMSMGGIKVIPGSTSNTLYISNIIVEGDFAHQIPAPVWFTAAPASMMAYVEGVEVADQGAFTTPAVQNDGTTGFGIFATNVFGYQKDVQGPMVVGAQYPSGVVGMTTSPLREGQAGVIGRHVIGQTDAARRGFSPSVARFTNLVPQTPASWTFSGGGLTTYTTGITAPDGTTNAAQVVTTAAGTQNLIFYDANRTCAVGDFFIGGAWVRSQAGGGWAGGAGGGNPIYSNIFNTAGFASTGQMHGADFFGDGEWNWVWFVQKVSTIGTNPCEVRFMLAFNSTYGLQMYAPVLMHIATGTISDNEAYDFAANMKSYPDTASVGDVAMLRGQRLNLMGNAITGIGASGTTLARYARYAVSLSPAAVAANTCAAQSFTVTGVVAGDILMGINKPTEQAGLSVTTGHVTGANAATLNFCNHTAASITPTGGETYNFVVVQ
jgi:hypothetical protein